ncbi:MAG: ABC transporter ATP-binding protein [Anaerolineae bacterium]
MISFNGVTYTYPDRERPALREATLTLPAGSFTLVVGPSGAGKSTLLRCLNGLVPHFSGGKLRGRIEVTGLNPVLATPNRMSRRVGFVFQDPESQFVMDCVEDELAFALENAAVPREEMRARVGELLARLELTALRHRSPMTLSGGEQQRVAIAAALALRPQILALDEPTSQLDPRAAAEVLTLLTRLKNELGITVVLAEHRLERVLPLTERVVYLSGAGQPPQVGRPEEILPHTGLLPPVGRLGKALHWQPLPLSVEAARPHAARLPHPTPPTTRRARPTGEAVLEMRQVSVAYAGTPVLRQVDLTVHAGEVVALMGPNGAGKTTLLRALSGLATPHEGQIRVGGHAIAGRSVAEICRDVGYLPQNPNALLFAETVEEELQITLRNHDLQECPPVEPAALLERLGLADKKARYPRDLSVGERQRVALGAILVTRPGALLLDEPTRGLDYTAKARLLQLLRRWREEALAILLVTHDVELAAEIADRVALLDEGKIVAQGRPEVVLRKATSFTPQIARLFPTTDWLTVEDVLRAPGMRRP